MIFSRLVVRVLKFNVSFFQIFLSVKFLVVKYQKSAKMSHFSIFRDLKKVIKYLQNYSVFGRLVVRVLKLKISFFSDIFKR